MSERQIHTHSKTKSFFFYSTQPKHLRIYLNALTLFQLHISSTHWIPQNATALFFLCFSLSLDMFLFLRWVCVKRVKWERTGMLFKYSESGWSPFYIFFSLYIPIVKMSENMKYDPWHFVKITLTRYFHLQHKLPILIISFFFLSFIFALFRR